MYRQAENLFKAAEEKQSYEPSFKKGWLETKDRELPQSIQSKLRSFKPTMPDGHVVTVVLKNGEKVPHVFIYKNREIKGVYDREKMDFTGSDIKDVEMIPSEALPPYKEHLWLRVDVVNS